jgi:hypothetical protein
MKSTRPSGNEPAAAMPVVDVSLLALLDDDAILAVTSAIATAAPDLAGHLRRLATVHPGLHVTLYEFLHAPGHDALPLARQWCEQSGAEVVARAGDIGLVTFRATSLRLSHNSGIIALEQGRPSTWVRDLVQACSMFEPPTHVRGRGPPDLHVTVARHLATPSQTAWTSKQCRLRFEIQLARFTLALALQLPYGRVHCLYTQGARPRWTP